MGRGWRGAWGLRRQHTQETPAFGALLRMPLVRVDKIGFELRDPGVPFGDGRVTRRLRGLAGGPLGTPLLDRGGLVAQGGLGLADAGLETRDLLQGLLDRGLGGLRLRRGLGPDGVDLLARERACGRPHGGQGLGGRGRDHRRQRDRGWRLGVRPPGAQMLGYGGEAAGAERLAHGLDGDGLTAITQVGRDGKDLFGCDA